MTKLTIEDYLTMTTSSKPFIGIANKPVCVISDEFQNILREYIAIMYPTYRLIAKLNRAYDESGEPLLTKSIQNICDTVYLSHTYTYQKLFDTTVVEYNPIENYDMTEVEEIKNTGSDTTTNNTDAHTDKTSLGAYTDTDNYAQDHSSSDSTGDKAPFDSQSYKHVDKGHEEMTRDARVDSHVRSATENSTDYGKQHDVSELEHGHNINRELTRHGNIGVTTTQQMLMSERQIAMFNFVKVVANDLIHFLSVCAFY